MNLAELRAKPIVDQLRYVLSSTPKPELMLQGLVFESTVRRAFLRRPPPEVSVLTFQQPAVRMLNEKVGAKRKPVDLSRLLTTEVIGFFRDDPDFFAAAVLPRAMSGGFELDLTWVVEFRGNLWAVVARLRTPSHGYYGVSLRQADYFAAQGLRHVVITGDGPRRLIACVVDEAARADSPKSFDKRHPQHLIKIAAERFKPLGDDFWLGLTELMSRS